MSCPSGTSHRTPMVEYESKIGFFANNLCICEEFCIGLNPGNLLLKYLFAT